MASERSTKRRKLDQGSQDPEISRSPTQQTRTPLRPSAATVNGSSRQSRASKRKAPETSSTRKIPLAAGTEHRQLTSDALNVDEEIVVRSSSRARRPSAKLQSDTVVVNTPVRATAPKHTKSRRNRETDDTQSQSAVKDDIEQTPPAKRAIAAGKENISPSPSKDPSAESLLLEDNAQSIVRPTKTTSLTKRKRSSHHIPSLPLEIAESDDGAASSGGATIDCMGKLQQEIMNRLTGRKRTKLVGMEEEFRKIDEVIKHTVEHGESNSLLLIGSRGSSKSSLLDSVLSAQTSEFHIVRLNGFIHTDDKLALREICRQLSQTDAQSYADNLTVLLALLSQIDQKSVVFVLDEFDLFATHPRQTLLYNLFDIAQSKKAPIAVIGLTTRVDIVEALEKRVKSRFSHRYVHLSLCRSLSTFIDICKMTLTADLRITSTVETWNSAIERFFASEIVTKELRQIYYRTKSIADFKAKMMIPLATMPIHAQLSAEAISEHLVTTLSACAPHGPDSKLDILGSLSMLHLALLVCAARQYAIYSTENVSFNLVYEEYKTITGKSKLQASVTGATSRAWSKETAKGAWENLTEVGLVLEDGRGCKVDIALQEIADSGVDLGQWAKWCKEI